ncbi:MAG: ChbG/HpnK family deacetylase [Oscillospiraceae bacterium]|nr:ChbG/HpnK family deacetylase [Oscillospiraceae bacterium]
MNFMEGKSCCPIDQVSLLVDEKGVFNISFLKLLLISFLPVHKQYRKQLSKEICAQIHAVLPYLSGKPLRIDSHSHYHMIPVVFDALMDVILEQELPVSYIRIPREHIKIYLRCKKKLMGFRPINLLKTLILNVLSRRNLSKYRNFEAGLEHSVFIGVLYSGRMCIQNIQALRPEAERLNQNIEILAHPGGVFEEEDIRQLTNKGDIAFLTSDFRKKEAIAFINLKTEDPV